MGRVGNLEDRISAVEKFIADFVDNMNEVAETAQARFEEFCENKFAEMTKDKKKKGDQDGDKD